MERQTSLAKHNLAFYEKQQVLVEKYMNSWTEIAKCREQIPESVESMFTSKLRVIPTYLIVYTTVPRYTVSIRLFSVLITRCAIAGFHAPTHVVRADE